MAYKINYNTTNPNSQGIKIPPQSQAPSNLQVAGAAITRPVAYLEEKLLGLPGDILGGKPYQHQLDPEEQIHYKKVTGRSHEEDMARERKPTLAEKYLPTSQDLHETNSRVLEHYFGKGANEAKSVPAKIANALALSLPINWLAGGSALLETGRTVAGSLLSQGTEALGGGPISQTIADQLGRSGFDLGRVITNSGNIRSQVSDLKRGLYKESDSLATPHKVPAKTTYDIVNKDLELLHKGKGGLEGAERASSLKTAKNILDDIKLGEVNLKEALDLRKSLNNTIKDLEYGSTKRQMYERWRDSINHEIIKPAQQQFPDFGKALSTADELHMAEKVPSTLRKYFNENASLEKQMHSPLGKLILTGGALRGNLAGAAGATAAKAAITYTGKGLMNALEPFYKSPTIRDLYRKIGVSIEEGALKGLPKQLLEFDREAQKLEKEKKRSYKINRKK